MIRQVRRLELVEPLSSLHEYSWHLKWVEMGVTSNHLRDAGYPNDTIEEFESYINQHALKYRKTMAYRLSPYDICRPFTSDMPRVICPFCDQMVLLTNDCKLRRHVVKDVAPYPCDGSSYSSPASKHEQQSQKIDAAKSLLAISRDLN